METFNVHVAGCWNSEDARGGVGVYWGQNDARNLSARCGNAITDTDSAGLDGVIRFLEQLGANSDCSAAPHDGNHFTIRTDNSNIVLWLTVNLPSWKEYDWEGDIQHKSFLRYIDALMENARTQASIEVAFLLVPSHREIAGQSGAMSLAGWASTSDKVPPEPEMKSFDERVYAVTLLELYTLSLQGISPTSPRVDVALKRLRTSRRSLKAAQRDKDTTTEDDVSAAPTEHDEVEILPAAEDQDRPRRIQPKDTPPGKQTRARVASPSSDLSAPVRSSEYYASHTAISWSRNLRTLAQICETVIPAFEESNLMWPDTSGLQHRVLKEFIALLRKHEPRKVEKGGKRKATGEPAASSHHDKKKKVSDSKSTPTTAKQKANIFDHLVVHPEAIARRLCGQATGKGNVPLRLVFVFCESEITRSATLLNHLPHLIGEVNARCKRKTVKLVRFSEGARQALNEIWDLGDFDAFAVEQNTCDMEVLWGVLSPVPLLKRT
ncbi:hypothetical protein BDZ89DRAFT_1162337 [Hymenopellis radicata]|nr:hypothetical protein BDZ89DRAFT_1162337 [Hymenopellis radicata]